MIISDKIYIPLDKLGRKVTELCDLFTYNNPDFFKKKHLKLSVRNVPKSINHYKIEVIDNVKYLVLPRGGIGRVKDFFMKHDIPYRIWDKRIIIDTTIDCRLYNVSLEPQQEKIIDVLNKNDGGLIEMDVAGGKTIAALGFIAKIKQPTLILFDKHRLKEQWLVDIKNKLTGNFTIGDYSEGRLIDGDIVLGLRQTVHKIIDTNTDYLERFGMVIVDECHSIPSDTFMKILHNIPAKYRIGITATAKRKDGKEQLLFDVIGPILTSIKANELKHRLTSFTFEMIDTNISMETPFRVRWTGKKREPVNDITGLITMLTRNNKRNMLILNKIIDDINNGYYPLVLSDRVEHNKFFHYELTKRGFKSILLIGKTKNEYDWEEVQNDSTIQVIVATTPIASEGLNIPLLSSLHLTCPSSNKPKIKQRIGRIRRSVEGKLLPVVRDYVDNLVYMKSTDDDGNEVLSYILRYSGLNRMKYYKKLQGEYN